MKRKLKWVVVLVLLGTVFVAASCSKKLINKQKESSNSKLEDKETALKEVEAKYLEKLNEIERLNSLLDSTDKDRQSLLKEKTALENEIEQLKTKMEELKQELEISKWVNANNGNEIFSDEIEDYLDNIYFVGQEEGEEHASFAFEKDNQMGYVFFKEGVEESYLASFTVKPAWQLAYQGEINEKTKITKAQLSLEYLGNKHKGILEMFMNLL